MKTTKEPSITLKHGTTQREGLVISPYGVHFIGIDYILGMKKPPQAPGSGCNVNLANRFLIPRADDESGPDTEFFTQGAEALGSRVWDDVEGRKRLVSRE